MRRRLLAAMAAAVLVTSCTTSSDGPPAASPSAGSSLRLVMNDGYEFGYARLPAGHVVTYGTSTGAVHAPIKVLEVRPLEQSGALSFTGAHVGFFACQPQCRARPGYWGSRILLSATCAAAAPTSRALYPAAGMELFPGDAPMFVLSFRVTSVADGVARGLRVTYEEAGQRHEVSSSVNSIVLSSTRQPEPTQCADPKTDPWFGGAELSRYTVAL